MLRTTVRGLLVVADRRRFGHDGPGRCRGGMVGADLRYAGVGADDAAVKRLRLTE